MTNKTNESKKAEKSNETFFDDIDLNKTRFIFYGFCRKCLEKFKNIKNIKDFKRFNESGIQEVHIIFLNN